MKMINQRKSINRFYIDVAIILLGALLFRTALADETHMWPVLTNVTLSSSTRGVAEWTTVPVTLTEAELDTIGCDQISNSSCMLSVLNRADKSIVTGNVDLTNRSHIQYLVVPGTNSITWREIFAHNTFIPGSVSLNSPNHLLHDSCYRIGILGKANRGLWPTDYPWSSVHREAFTPPGVSAVNSAECIGTPPLNHWCAPETDTLDFDFGVIVPSEISSVQRSKDIVIRCTSDMKFKLNLFQQNEMPGSISLSNGLKALFKIEGDDLSETVQQGVEGTISLPLTASLTGNADSAGFFEGSGVIGISYP